MKPAAYAAPVVSGHDEVTTVRVYVGALEDALWGKVSPTARAAATSSAAHVGDLDARIAEANGTPAPGARPPVVEVSIMGRPEAVRVVVETLVAASQSLAAHELAALIAAATRGDANEPAAE